VAQVLGVPADALQNLNLVTPTAPAPLTTPELTAARRVALRNRSDVLAALARYEASETTLTLELARQYPDLHLGPGYQWDQGADKWSLALTLDLPVFNHNQGPIAEAVARRKEAAANFIAVQAGVIAEIDAAAASQAAAAARTAGLNRVQEELQRRQSSVQARLAAGAADQLEVRTAELDLATGQLALIDAEAQATVAAGQLEDALQVPFPHLEALIAPGQTNLNRSLP
jgi:outer membrane protein TolC